MKCYNLFKCQLMDYCMFQMFNQITNRNNPNEEKSKLCITEIERFLLFILQLCPVTIQITSNHDLTIISKIKVLTGHLYNYNAMMISQMSIICDVEQSHVDKFHCQNLGKTVCYCIYVYFIINDQL